MNKTIICLTVLKMYSIIIILDNPPDRFKTIISSSHIHILMNGSLNFRSIESSDAGFYLCEANNGVGSGLSTVVRLTVHSKYPIIFLLYVCRVFTI